MRKLDSDELENANGGRISSEAAYQKALSYAGLNKHQAMIKKNELIEDTDHPEYNIKFVSGGVMYEFFINAETGKVLGYSSGKLG